MITKPCRIHDLEQLIQEYIRTLSSPIDSFLEEHILESSFYIILDGSKEVGYYAIHGNRLLTQFYMSRSHRMHAQHLFSQALENHSVKSLFVPTCDELYLSLALDKDFKIAKQAYFFQDSQVEIAENDAVQGDMFRLANAAELLQIQQICGDFLDRYEARIANGELFAYFRGTELLGIGVLEKSRLQSGLASIGMFTNEAYRRQGIGRSIILRLKALCYARHLTPICGCWYYNDASKRTLESAGMVTQTRLLNIEVSHV